MQKNELIVHLICSWLRYYTKFERVVWWKATHIHVIHLFNLFVWREKKRFSSFKMPNLNAICNSIEIAWFHQYPNLMHGEKMMRDILCDAHCFLAVVGNTNLQTITLKIIICAIYYYFILKICLPIAFKSSYNLLILLRNTRQAHQRNDCKLL